MASPERPLPRSPWRRHHWHDPALRQLAQVADALTAQMMATGGRGQGGWRTSLREEARRSGRSVYEIRVERARIEALESGQPVPTAREAAGHYRPGQRPGARITALLDEPPRASVVEVDRRTAQRVGRHAELARILAAGGSYRGRPLTPERFRRLVSRWAPVTVRGGDEEPGQYRLLADPGAVLALLDAQRRGEAPAFEYVRVRG